MTIKILSDLEWEVVDSFDEDNEVAFSHNEVIKASEVFDVDLIHNNDDTVNLQFEDGSMVFNIPKSAYEVCS